MGPADDPDAVVDQAGRLHGVDGLHLADTSILPAVPRRGPANTAVLIGEVVADALRRPVAALTLLRRLEAMNRHARRMSTPPSALSTDQAGTQCPPVRAFPRSTVQRADRLSR